MTTRTTPFAPGTPCWVDLLTSDLAQARAFYGDLLGWEFTDSGPEYGGYVMATSDGHQVAGLMANNGQSGAPDAWTTYLATTDVDADVAKATELGARALMGPMEVADTGAMAVLLDPAGGAVGLWQAGQHTGFSKYNEPGSVSWNEHHSKDFAASTSFYTSLLGWGLTVVADTDEFRYVTATVDGEDVAGLMDSAAFLPPEVPSHWAVYFSTDDADAATTKAVAAGATVLRGPEDTPYGRLSDLLDPTGAAFKLLGPNVGSGAAEATEETAVSA